MPFEFSIGGGLEDGSWRFGPFPRFIVTELPVGGQGLHNAPEATYITINDEDGEVSFERAHQLVRWMHENIGSGSHQDWRVDRPTSRVIYVAIRDPRQAVAFKLRWWP